MMIRTASLIFALYLSIFGAVAQKSLLTVAEKSEFKSTSAYADVTSFISGLLKMSPYVRVESIGTSTEGRDIPLLVLADPMVKSPSALLNDKRMVVYIQANIHAGEVEGKEASLMLARDILADKKPALLKDLVILICPNFNPDGNEQISPKNRTHQVGPENGVGVRHNGQMLDLNRDGMKAESPEVRGLLANVFNKWDPYIFVDCHTTNGSYHVEPVTFTWMVSPNGDRSLVNYMSDKMMPEVNRTLLTKYNVENCFYGEFANMMDPGRGWFFDASEPRYIVNYFGLRNRLGILNENYVYADFKSRVWGCYYLLKSIAEYAVINRETIKSIISEADKKTISRGESPTVNDSIPYEYKVRPLPGLVTIKTYVAEQYTDPNGRRGFRKTDRRQDVTIPYFIDYYGTRKVRMPFAYVLTNNDPAVLNLLKLHGIKLEKLTSNVKVNAEKFTITELKGAARLNQGHYSNTVKGSWAGEMTEFMKGAYIIRTGQPLANVASYLLEPQTNDGLLLWNFFDKYLAPQWGGGFNPYPVYRIMDPANLPVVKI
ncbi:MAG: M14 family metallopeptidase [Bacteroidales bacterium]